MKKGVAIIILIGVIISIVGAIILGIAISKDYFKANQLTVNNSYDLTEDFEDIDINISITNLEIKIANVDKCNVTCVEKEKQYHEVKVENKTLIINKIDKRKWYEKFFMFDIERMKIVITLPNKDYKNLNLKTSTGDTIITDLILNNINLEASTGNINLENIKSADAYIEASTGDLNLKNITSTNVELKTSTGNINFKDYIIENTLKASASTGNITFEKIDAKDINISTSTGNISGSIITPKTFTTNTSTGDIKVPNTTGNPCKLSTSTGNIIITVINE